MPQPTTASRLKRATARRETSEQAWKDAIRAAHDEGMPLRTIATLAGVSHQRIHQLLRAIN